MKLEKLPAKVLSMIVFGCALPNAQAYAEGPESSGGGDFCQNRIEEIRNDIEKWILASALLGPQGQKQGSAQLDFSYSKTSLDKYNSKMLQLIQLTRDDGQASISCTNDQSLVRVEGQDKMCMASWNSGNPRILCYRGKVQNGKYVDGIMAAPADEQYFQVHHEFAVLSGFEDLEGEQSNYTLSRQVSESLEEHTDMKLAILKGAAASSRSWPSRPKVYFADYNEFSQETYYEIYRVFQEKGYEFVDKQDNANLVVRYNVDSESMPFFWCKKQSFEFQSLDSREAWTLKKTAIGFRYFLVLNRSFRQLLRAVPTSKELEHLLAPIPPKPADGFLYIYK